jgi:hypothetical protein
MRRNLSLAEVESLQPGDRVLVQLYGDRHETACAVVEQDDGKLHVRDPYEASHSIAREQVTALLEEAS